MAVTADHGEALGEHGEDTHGLFVYDAMVRVPLILRLPGVVPAGRRLAGLVSGVDLVPTVLQLLGLPALPPAQGKSFAAAARGGGPGAREPVYSESVYGERAYGWAPLTALREVERKFIEAPEPELYDLLRDPDETRNLAPGRASDIAACRKRLAGTLEAIGSPRESSAQPMDAEQRERLASLGYLSGGAPGAGRRTGADPKKLVAQHNAVLTAKALVSKNRLDEARTLLQGVLKADPGNPTAMALGGALLFSHGEREKGLSQLEAAARVAPGDYETQRNFANALHVSGRLADAARAYRAALSIHPFSGEDHYGLGNVLFAMKDSRGAIAEYKEAIRRGHATAGVHAALGVALSTIGDDKGAEASLLTAVGVDPGLGGAWSALGILSEKAGRAAEARARYEKALATQPDLAEGLHNHARICLLLRDLTAANRDLERLLRKDPKDPRTLFLQANLRMAAGDMEGARRALRECLARPNVDSRILQKARAILDDLDKKPN